MKELSRREGFDFVEPAFTQTVEHCLREPFRLLWEIPLETRDVRAAFDFKDIPLPN